MRISTLIITIILIFGLLGVPNCTFAQESGFTESDISLQHSTSTLMSDSFIPLLKGGGGRGGGGSRSRGFRGSGSGYGGNSTNSGSSTDIWGILEIIGIIVIVILSIGGSIRNFISKFGYNKDKELSDSGYVVCEECRGYYKLEKGESPDDFDKCQCGGSLKYYKDSYKL